MAYFFGDGFDCYATVNDATSGYWDSGGAIGTLIAGRFSGSQALSYVNNVSSPYLVKSSSVNDAVHHITIAYRQTAVLSGTTLGLYFQLSDAATNQVCIVFRSDGVILLTSATPAGTTLATYSGAITAANTWFAFEFEVVINNTTGRFRARKNGSTVDDFDSGATLNTRPGANAYANKLTVGIQASVNATQIDDLLWRSDASSVPFVGDIRAYTRMPASDASVQFARSPSPAAVSVAATSTGTDATGTARYTPFTATYTGTVGTVAAGFNPGFTGNCKMSIFADASGNPAAVLGSASVVTNPAAGLNTFTFGTPVAVTKGTVYWIGISHDVSATLQVASGSSAKTSVGVTYAAFPTASPAVIGGNPPMTSAVNITPTISAEYVNETLQDGTTSYVYSGNVNDQDLYNIAPIASTPVSVVAVTTRGFLQKSDAGTRGAAVQLKSGGTTVGGTPTLLSTSFGWLWRTDLTDPATSAAWTATGVNGVQIGPKVTS